MECQKGNSNNFKKKDVLQMVGTSYFDQHRSKLKWILGGHWIISLLKHILSESWVLGK